MNEELVAGIRNLLSDIGRFCARAGGVTLRAYQQDPAYAILRSIVERHGDTIVVIFPRQSGKNELQAQLESYLLLLFSQVGGEIVKVSPTQQPQSVTSMRRLDRVLGNNILTRGRYSKSRGYIYRIGASHIYFLSAGPGSNVIGHTASVLLSVDEAQAVDPARYDADFVPMTASTNATRVLWGTAWTRTTLLAREKRAALEAEKLDGRRRVFTVTAEDVAAEVPAYREHVAAEIRKHGRQHPLIRTQYFCEEIDAEGGLFPPERRAMMLGQHPAELAPAPGAIYALLVDVAGEDETGGGDPAELTNPARDATALTIVRVIPPADEFEPGPTYHVVARRQWIGTKHTALYSEIKAIAEHWRARYIVADATGVGAGLVSFLDRALPSRVLPYVFNARTKSDLGYNFLSAVDTGRFKDYAPADALQVEFIRQLENVTYEARPDQSMRWSVPDGTRVAGELVHDDLVLSAALCSVLDAQTWGMARSEVIGPADPYAGMKKVY